MSYFIFFDCKINYSFTPYLWGAGDEVSALSVSIQTFKKTNIENVIYEKKGKYYFGSSIYTDEDRYNNVKRVNKVR